MKNTVVILLSILLLAVSVRDMFTILSFEINQELLTEKYCINLDNSDLMCSASCYLSVILEENSKEKDLLPALHLGDQVLFVAHSPQELSGKVSAKVKPIISIRDQIDQGQLFQNKIFQPPRFS